ncbi:hypothetical protein L3X38_037716 [Prunus dulcis]|uniref:Uncharacterized protein n=1 Tax=Prunus dulcis TaxID=3755 RepID=A0AAD4YRH6_PRUDU|nr:hypothetical protein L3X38_037716 [Prunus dulcis]
MYGVNRVAEAVCGGRSRVEKIWRVERERELQVRLLRSPTDNDPFEDANDPGARIITFRPFYFSLGFKFPLSKLFKEVFCAMGSALSQSTPNVYRAIMCFENLSCFFMLELTVREFFYISISHILDFILHSQWQTCKRFWRGKSEKLEKECVDELQVKGRKEN